MPSPTYDFDCKREPENAGRISVEEIARRLNVGRQAVYAMLEAGILPGIRLGRRWIITRQALQAWERTCGMRHCAQPQNTDGDSDEANLTDPRPNAMQPRVQTQ